MAKDSLEERVVALESRLAFQEDAIRILNHSTLEQRKEVDRMSMEIEHLRQRLMAITLSPLDSDEPEIPPHY